MSACLRWTPSIRRASSRAGSTPAIPQTTWALPGVYSTDAYSTGEAALLVHEAKQLLDWRDLVFSVAMHGLNSSVTPLSAVPQRIERPYPYANWQAERLLAVLGDSYLFDLEFEIVNGELEGFPRLLQDPLSFRNYPWRGGSAWKAWDQLEKLVVTAMNTSDHNPSTAPGVRPKDSPELQTPWLMRHYVEPTPEDTPYEGWESEGGFTLSNSNYHQSELANDVEHLTLALASATHQVFLRARRISEPFFSVIRPEDVLSPRSSSGLPRGTTGSRCCRLCSTSLNALIIPIPLDHDYRPEWPDEEDLDERSNRQGEGHRRYGAPPDEPGAPRGLVLDGCPSGTEPRAEVRRRAHVHMGGVPRGHPLADGSRGPAAEPRRDCVRVPARQRSRELSGGPLTRSRRSGRARERTSLLPRLKRRRPPSGFRGRPSRRLVRRAVLAGLLANALLMAAGCSGGDKPAPGPNHVDTILGATSNIVFQCRAVERGFMSIDEEALDRDVDALVEAAEELDPDATFPPTAVARARRAGRRRGRARRDVAPRAIRAG